MDTINERIKKIRNNMSQQEFADFIGVKRNVIADLERGKTKKPNKFLVEKIVEKLHINPDWLLKGEGNMYNPSKSSTKLDELKNSIKNIENNTTEIQIPFYENIYASAGAGATYVDTIQPDEKVSFSKSFLIKILNIINFTGLHLITAVGDSMNPTIFDGDKLFVLPMKKDNIDDGGVYVLSTPYGILVKRIYIYPIEKKFILHSDNPNVKDEEVKGEIIDDIKIIGRVVGILRNKI